MHGHNAYTHMQVYRYVQACYMSSGKRVNISVYIHMYMCRCVYKCVDLYMCMNLIVLVCL